MINGTMISLMYTLYCIHTIQKKTKQVTALCKKNSFFIELARMSAGSKLATAINKVLQPNTTTPQTATK